MPYQHTLFGSLTDGTVTLLALRNRGKQVIAYAMIDTADAQWAEQWRWHRTLKGYAARGVYVDGHNQTVFLHRELLGLPRMGREPQGDHINRDRLDNRRANLRVGSAALNAQNRPALGGSSQYRGVYWHGQSQHWRAVAQFDGSPLVIGSYRTEEDAACAVAHWRALYMPGAVEDPALLAKAPPPAIGKARGEGVGIAKLNDAKVREMRARYAAGGVLQRELATDYGVKQATISAILRRETWRHVD